MFLCFCHHTKWYIHKGLRGNVAGGTDPGDDWGERRQGDSYRRSFPTENNLSSSQSQILRPDKLQEGISGNEGQASERWVREPLLHQKMP